MVVGWLVLVSEVMLTDAELWTVDEECCGGGVIALYNIIGSPVLLGTIATLGRQVLFCTAFHQHKRKRSSL